MRLASALLLSLLLVSPALAQGWTDPFAFLPLDPGNEWVFERFDHYPTDPGATRLGIERWEVVGDTTIDGASAALVVQERFGTDGTPESAARCAIGQALQTSLPGHSYVEVTFTEVRGHCSVLLNERAWETQDSTTYSATFDDLRPFEVGGIGYPARPVQSWEHPTFDATEVWGVEFELVYDVGPTYLRWYYDAPGSAGDRELVLMLAYAELHGATFGVPVAAEPAAASSTLRLDLRGSNPVRSTVTLHLTSARPEAVRLEVFDALGRRVHAASALPGAVRLEAGTWAPGRYVVRATAADGQAATARLVRAD